MTTKKRVRQNASALSVKDMVNPASPRERLVLSALVGNFITTNQRRLYCLFEGDMVMALVFGEIAQHNMSRALRTLMAMSAKQSMPWKRQVETFELEPIAQCNSLSISEATGIPRETVRRKVKELLRRNWLISEGANRLSVAPDAIDIMRGLTREMMKEFVATAQVVNSLSQAGQVEGTPRKRAKAETKRTS